MAVVNEVITKFGYQGSISPLENFNKGLNQSIKGLLVSVTALAASAAAFNVWAKGVSVSIGEILHLSDETGVAIERIQELGFAASVAGSSNQKLERTLSSLSSKIGEAGQRGNETFQRLSISVRDANGQIKSADKVLFEIGNRFKSLGLSLSEQRTYAEALGIDPSLLKLTKMTGKELAKLTEEAKENGIITERQAKDTEELNDSNRRLLATYQAMSKQLVASLAPDMKETTDLFRDFLLANKDLIADGLKIVLETIKELGKALMRLFPVLAAAAGVFVVLKIATLGWAGALALVASPILIVSALLIAAAVILDDLIVAFQGGDSVIAGFLKDWLNWDIRPMLKDVVKVFKDTMKVFKKLFTEDFAGGLYDIFIKPFKDVVRDMKLEFKNLLPGWAIKLLPGQGSTSGQTTTNTANNVSQDIKIEIKTDNPQIAGAMVKDGLQEQLKDARTQSNRGGV